MAKTKNKKNNKADGISNKKQSALKKKLNPFEVHINKEKFKVLGRKLKTDRGLPGVARAKALSIRKETLLPEYKLMHKANQFSDKRIGEHDKKLSDADKSIARYTAIKKKQHNKKSIFNLADDEVLTHRGQTLSEIEKFDDPRSDDEEDGDKLDDKFVGDAHFGGGMLKKSDGKSHKDLIDQLISESKKRKAEMQRKKETTLDLTEKLDSEWGDLLPLVNKKLKTDDDSIEKNSDEYDKVMRELKFEARGVPSDKLKTEDEIAREEKEKLEKLERERLDRMHGITKEQQKHSHRSADDLEDNFAFDDDINDVTLSYNAEGESNVPIDTNIKDKNADASDDDESGVADDSGEDEEAETDDDLSDLKESDPESEDDVEENKDAEEKEEPDEDNEENEEEPPSLELRKNKARMEASPISTGETLEAEEEELNDPPTLQLRKTTQKSPTTKGILKNAVKEPEPEVKQTPEEIKEDLIRRKEMMEKARSELPFTFNLPESYDSLQSTLEGKSPEAHGIIIERMIKCNHPSLKEGNKEQLELLLVYLLQYLNDICTEELNTDGIRNVFQIFSNVCPHFFDLAQMNPKSAAASFVEILKEKHQDFQGKKAYSGIENLLYFKLISCLFSTSDFRHGVVCPTVVFIESLLLKAKVRTKRDISYGLFLVCIILEYSLLSKRYLPAAIQFLNGILHMAIPKTVRLLKICPPFKSTSSLLVLRKQVKEYAVKLDVSDLLGGEITEEFKHSLQHITVSLLKKFYQQFLNYPSCFEIFEGSLNLLQLLPSDYQSEELQRELSNFINSLEELKTHRKLDYLQFNKQRPKALRLYEPSIVKVFDGKTHKVQSKEKAERDKLIYKVKKEKKAALREVRRDKSFIAKVKLDQKLASDAERRERVKRIYAEANSQQSELNALDRSNRRKKK